MKALTTSEDLSSSPRAHKAVHADSATNDVQPNSTGIRTPPPAGAGKLASSQTQEHYGTPTSSSNTSSPKGQHVKEDAHFLNLLRDELKESLDEEEILLKRLAELVEIRSDLQTRVQRQETEAQLSNLRQRENHIRDTKHSFDF